MHVIYYETGNRLIKKCRNEKRIIKLPQNEARKYPITPLSISSEEVDDILIDGFRYSNVSNTSVNTVKHRLSFPGNSILWQFLILFS